LARLGFSFILLTIVFAWGGYRTHRGDRGPDQQVTMYAFYAAAALCFGLGLRGLHERHRMLREEDETPRRDESENR
jgi:hypothetical protein